MTDFLTYLEESALVANVLSLMALGLMGVVLRAIVRAASDIATGNAQLRDKMDVYHKIAQVEEITYLTAVMYKNAIINSTLSPEAKQQALTDFAKIELAHSVVIDDEPQPEPEPALTKAEQLINEGLEIAKANITAAAPTILDKLKAEVEETN